MVLYRYFQSFVGLHPNTVKAPTSCTLNLTQVIDAPIWSCYLWVHSSSLVMASVFLNQPTSRPATRSIAMPQSRSEASTRWRPSSRLSLPCGDYFKLAESLIGPLGGSALSSSVAGHITIAITNQSYTIFSDFSSQDGPNVKTLDRPP
jgi:hypothetical protein